MLNPIKLYAHLFLLVLLNGCSYTHTHNPHPCINSVTHKHFNHKIKHSHKYNVRCPRIIINKHKLKKMGLYDGPFDAKVTPKYKQAMIMALQTKLKKKGNYQGKIDGVVTPQLRKHLEKVK